MLSCKAELHDLPHFTPVASTIGGLLIGLASALLLARRGRIAGISGLLGNLVERDGERAVSGSFALGLLAAGWAGLLLAPEAFGSGAANGSMWALAGGGLLVGLGTRLGRGCTSGHGVCGIGRGSKTSLVATAVFMAVAMATVYVVRHGIGGAG